MKKLALAALGGLFMSTAALAAGSPADLSAQWLTEGGKSRVEIGACPTAPTQLCGKIVWLREPTNPDGSAKVDKENSDEALKKRPILGLQMLRDFKWDGEKWDDGYIYNPEDGKEYDSVIRIKGAGELEVKGCVLFICKRQAWTDPKKGS